MIHRNNRGETRVLVAALIGMTLLLAAAVAIAVNDVRTAQNHPFGSPVTQLRTDAPAPADAD